MTVIRWLRHMGLIVVALLAIAGPVRGEDQAREKAIAHFKRGTSLYKISKYSEALHEYEQAFLAREDPALLFNIAQCHRQMGNNAQALTLYRRYLREAPNARNSSEVENRVVELEAQQRGAPSRPMQRPAAPPVADPASPASPSIAAPAVVDGLPSPAVAAPPAPAFEPAILTAPPAPRAEATDSPPIYTRWWFWTGIGVLLAAGAVAAIAATSGAVVPDCQGEPRCVGIR